MPHLPLSEQVARSASVCELFQSTARHNADQIALRTPDGGVSLTWRQYAERVQRVAAGLARLGVARGDTVAIMLTNRPEFHVVDTAAYHLGAVPFSIYNTSPVEQIAYIFNNAKNAVAVCEAQFLPVVLEARSHGGPEHIICVDDNSENVMSLADLEALASPGFPFEETWQAVEPDDLLTLIYTSGTTGPPKGVELTHRGALAMTSSMLRVPEMAAGLTGGRAVSYLPDAHALNRWLGQYAAAATGTTITTVADARTLIDVLPTVRPTIFIAVPMLWYKLQGAIEAAVADEPTARARVARWALAVGRSQAACEVAGRPVPVLLRAQHAVAERLVLRSLRERIGLDHVSLALTGAAPIAPETLEFILGVGITCSEGWGMSEILVCTINPPEAIRPGTVGKALPGVEIKLADDGEILVQSPSTMRGYRSDPDRTAETIDAAGWVRTGDIGTLSADGYLSIVDRKKELIINSAGKNLSPANIENAVKAQLPLASYVVAIGDRRKYITALLVLDSDEAARFAREHGLSDVSAEALSAHPAVLEAISSGVTRANAHLARVEQVKNFTILPAYWEPGSDELTPTMKLKRKSIAEKYAVEIDALYAPKSES